MEKFKLSALSSSFKWAITAYLFLAGLGFGAAALQSYDRYRWNHEKTIQHYLGDLAEGEIALPKSYSYLLGVTHVHSFTMPLVFLTVWIALQGVPLRPGFKKAMILGGALSILLYNAAPYLVRFVAPSWVGLFTLGGVGLFLFFLGPVFFILYELWFGFLREER